MTGRKEEKSVSPPEMLKVALIQQSCTADKAENIAHSTELIRQAKRAGAELVVLPELHSTLYFCQQEDPQYFSWAESIPGQTSEWFSALARELQIVLVVSLFERRTTGVYHNTTVVLETDGRLLGKYRKMHIPDDPGYYEKFYFTPGDLGFQPIATSLGRLGVLICWDQWFPEAARLMALAGADLLIYPTAIGWNHHEPLAEQQRQLDAWLTVQRAQAITNSLPVISANRVGYEAHPVHSEQGIQFWGNSFICSAGGEILQQTDSTETTALVQNLDLSETERLRGIWPFLRDRRVDCYHDLLRLAVD